MIRASFSFQTWAGTCRLSWSENGVNVVGLVSTPEGERNAQLLPRPVRKMVLQLEEFFAGRPQAFDAQALDFQNIPSFDHQVYRETVLIPRGRTATYGEVAEKIGRNGASRAVGGALRRNPFLIVVPCHRVIASTGHLTGFSAIGGLSTKARLLDMEKKNSGFDPANRLL